MLSLNAQLLPENLIGLGYELEITGDGSPTLRLPNQGESMHHSGGAAAETKYIYGDVLDQAHQNRSGSCKTCIVGLGLGFIEISWAMSLIKNKLRPSKQITFHSFEIVPELIENFQAWVQSENTNSVYDQFIEKRNANPVGVKEVLCLALQNGSTLNGDITKAQNHQEKCNVICYDAFSQKTNSGLWSAEFLENFIQQYAALDCVLTTYACTGILKKTLIAKNFLFHKRPGFCGKRDSSLAARGSFKRDFPIFQTFSCNQ